MMSSSGPGSNNPQPPPPYPGFSPGHPPQPHSSPSTTSSVASPSFPAPTHSAKATPPHMGSLTPGSQHAGHTYTDAEEKQRVRFQVRDRLPGLLIRI